MKTETKKVCVELSANEAEYLRYTMLDQISLEMGKAQKGYCKRIATKIDRAQKQ
jgi:hypothetical protein